MFLLVTRYTSINFYIPLPSLSKESAGLGMSLDSGPTGGAKYTSAGEIAHQLTVNTALSEDLSLVTMVGEHLESHL